MKRLLIFSLLSFYLFIQSGCSNNKDPKNNNLTSTTASKPLDRGDFILGYVPPKDDFYAKIIQALKDDGRVEVMVNELNRLFALPHNVPVTFVNNEDPNAYYFPDTKSIEFDLEFVDMIAEILEDNTGANAEEVEATAINAAIFMLFHEVGHALIDIYNLKKTSQEEDMVDHFAVFLLSTGNEESEKAALDGATFFYSMFNQYGLPADLRAYADEHSIDIKRCYNIINLLYGKNPTKYSYLVQRGILPADTYDRTPRLTKEYEDIMEGWRTTLLPHLLIN